MSNLTNLLRDQAYVEPLAERLGYGTENDKGKVIWMRSTGIVNQTRAMATTLEAVVSTAANRWFGSGVLIKGPIVDSTPYRVKVHALSSGVATYVFLAYPETTTGLDRCINTIAFPLGYDGGMQFDEVINVPAWPESDPLHESPIAIGVAAGQAIKGSGELIEYYLSVQNLAQTAPKFAASMS